jgi:hypothetical protein
MAAKKKLSSDSRPMRRYAARLLFQFVPSNEDRPKRRLYEERIVLIESPDARGASKEARRRGRRKQYSYRSAVCRVRFQFVGVVELLRLDLLCEPDEVWYELRCRSTPSHRRTPLVPDPSRLDAIWEEENRNKRP